MFLKSCGSNNWLNFDVITYRTMNYVFMGSVITSMRF